MSLKRRSLKAGNDYMHTPRLSFGITTGPGAAHLAEVAFDRFVTVAWTEILVLRDAPQELRSLRHEDFY